MVFACLCYPVTFSKEGVGVQVTFSCSHLLVASPTTLKDITSSRGSRAPQRHRRRWKPCADRSRPVARKSIISRQQLLLPRNKRGCNPLIFASIASCSGRELRCIATAGNAQTWAMGIADTVPQSQCRCGVQQVKVVPASQQTLSSGGWPHQHYRRRCLR